MSDQQPIGDQTNLATKNGASSRNGQPKPVPEEAEMSFLDHLEELRWHIIRALIAIVGTGIVLFIFQGWLFRVVIFGPTQKDFLSYRMMGKGIEWLNLNLIPKISTWLDREIGALSKLVPPDFEVIATGFAEPFIIAIQVSFIGGFIGGLQHLKCL